METITEREYLTNGQSMVSSQPVTRASADKWPAVDSATDRDDPFFGMLWISVTNYLYLSGFVSCLLVYILFTSIYFIVYTVRVLSLMLQDTLQHGQCMSGTYLKCYFCGVLTCYWPAYWATIVLLAGVCRRLSSSSVVVCNAAGVAGRPAAARVDGRRAGGRVGGWAADTARRASTVVFRYGDTLF